VARQETGISAVWALVSEGEFLEYFKLRMEMILIPYRNVNIPWPDQGMGDGDYMYAFQEVVMPIAQEFDPDLVISK
jgi:acetoin utilization deacetylase AcuC-like enzyme